jgi:hypothetical protein
MHGQITKFRADIGFGVIEAENGRRYRFAKHELVNAARPLVGEEVDFVLVAGRPCQIIMMVGSAWTAFGDICARAANDRR